MGGMFFSLTFFLSGQGMGTMFKLQHKNQSKRFSVSEGISIRSEGILTEDGKV